MPEHQNLAAALVAALADLMVVEKGRTANAGSYSYDYADIGDVVKRTRPALAEHGVVVLTPVHEHGNGLACTVVFLHSSGDRLDFGPFPFPHGKDAQATGSMVTYHRRYALVAALGMAAGDDDDGASAVPRERQASVVQESPYISAENAEALRQRCADNDLDVAEVVKIGTSGRTSEPGEVLRTEVKAIKEAIDTLTPAEGPGAGEAGDREASDSDTAASTSPVSVKPGNGRA